MPQTITTAGGNCFALAAQFLGDATQFVRILQANALTDPFLPSVPTTLIIPDPDPTQTGGVPVQ